ncbi:MAG: MoaD/ThiS family protein, partial [Candidatus Tectomicrobia bacterium]|nr:MoaD/ThiS family protein [Candidatus Tectomicrobia bacterium]
MRITVRFYAHLTAYLPPGATGNRVELVLEDGATGGELLASLGIPAEVASASLLLINGEHGRLSQGLKEGDQVSLLPPIYGGSGSLKPGAKIGGRAMERGGYAGKILRVDLTTRELKEEVLSPQVLRQFVGGTGIGAQILYDEVPAGVEPYDPQNRLIFATGPLNGTLVPGSGTFAVVTKSPLTGFASAGHANGFFGARLKQAGYDAVVVQGGSPEWVYLSLNDGQAELREATWLVGKDAWETEMALRERHGQKGMDLGLSVACIGPAGESRVRFAAVCSDRGHVASSGGPGAVMGSKRLKAIVAEGTRGIPVHERDLGRLKGLIQGWIDSASASPFGRAVSQGGTAGFFSAAENMGWLPVRNLTANYFPEHPAFSGASLRSTFNTKPRACH